MSRELRSSIEERRPRCAQSAALAVARSRRLQAWGMVGALALGFALALVLVPDPGPGSELTLGSASTVSSPWTLIDEVTHAQERSLPGWFETEIGEWPYGTEAVDESGSVVALSAPLSRTACYEHLAGLLQVHGWQGGSAGITGIYSFAKSEGEKTWLMLTLSEGEGETLVVLQAV